MRKNFRKKNVPFIEIIFIPADEKIYSAFIKSFTIKKTKNTINININ